MRSPTPSRLALFALLPLLNGDVSTTMALQPSSSSSSSEPRRSFLARGVSITGAAFLATATADHVAGCACGACSSSSSQHRFFHPQAANAFERRDVGGTDASPATKAMNEQAYQTQARLERDGVRLEVRTLLSSTILVVLVATLMPTTTYHKTQNSNHCIVCQMIVSK